MQTLAPIIRTVQIQSSASIVWSHLTVPTLMKEWMLDQGMELEIVTNWQVGEPFILKGLLHDIPFENKGKVLQYNFEKTLAYSHLSSFSDLPDTINSYTTIRFDLKEKDQQTELTLTIENFPTHSIYKHLELYWSSALAVLKQTVELSNSTNIG